MKNVLDDALERLRHTGPEEADGAPNHGPMAAEALVALGCDDEVPQWVDYYRRHLGPMPETLLPLTTQTWRDALGIQRRVGDWVVFFRLQLSAAPWQAVLTAWLPRLIPGAMAHGTHGLIRTAHACAPSRMPRPRSGWRNSPQRSDTGPPTIRSCPACRTSPVPVPSTRHWIKSPASVATTTGVSP